MEDEEYLDIVDRNDKVVGRDTRNNIWKRGLEHNVRVVNIFVLNAENKILLPTRSMKKKIFPGCYDFSCGEHVRSGESYLEAAKRGLNEELSIKEAKIQELGKMTPKVISPRSKLCKSQQKWRKRQLARNSRLRERSERKNFQDPPPMNLKS